MEKIQQSWIYFYCGCHKTYSVLHSTRQKLIQQCYGPKQTLIPSAVETLVTQRQIGRLFSLLDLTHRKLGHFCE